MAAVDTFSPLFHEIFTKVNNTKDKPKKVAVLREYRTEALENFLMAAFNPSITWLLPEGMVPYIPNEAPDGTEHTRLSSEAVKLFHYVQREGTPQGSFQGNADINSAKREMMFIQLLEGLSAGEAEDLCLAKDQSLNKKYKGLNANVVREAFGWNADFVAV